MVSYADRDDRSPPEYCAADLHGDPVSKRDGELPPHAFQQSRAALLAAMLPTTEQPDGAQGHPVQGTKTTKPQQPDLGNDIHTAHPPLNPRPIGAPNGGPARQGQPRGHATPFAMMLRWRAGGPTHGACPWGPPTAPLPATVRSNPSAPACRASPSLSRCAASGAGPEVNAT